MNQPAHFLIQIAYKINEKITSPGFIALHRKNPNDFTRNRKLTFPHLITFLLNMVNGSIQSELNRFFEIIHDEAITFKGVTTAAFCKARLKFSYTAFKALNTCLTDMFYRSSHVRRWKGFRLLAIDSSVTELYNSKALMAYFGKAREVADFPATRLSQLYDITNKLTVDLEVALHSTGERALAVRHLLAHATINDLVLYDRGYPATWLFILHHTKNIHFCARAPLDFSNTMKAFLASRKKEALVTLPVIDKSLRKCREMGLPTIPIVCRFIRIKLPNGDTEVLITSLLDRKQYPHSIFSDLYHKRWFIEEDYKLMKSRLEIENISGISVEAVKQDIHAKILTKNIAAIAISEAEKISAEKTQHRILKYKINFTQALSSLKDKIVRLTLCLGCTGLSQKLIARIATALSAIRPGRRFRRKDRRIYRKKDPLAYKKIR